MPMVTSIHFNHKGKPYEVAIKRERRKDYRLKIRKSGELVASIPQKASLKTLEEFLERRREEIGQYLDRVSSYMERIPRYSFFEGELITFAALPFRVQKTAIKPEHNLKAAVDEKRLVIRIYSGSKLNETPFATYEQQAAEAVEEALMAFSKKWFANRVQYYGQRMSLQPSAVKISRAKTRYGSCSSRGSLNFCWRILLAPQFVADYIIVHELAHLAHLNHSKAFYSVVESAMPDYRDAQNWLKKNAALLEWPV
jgi:predicted metal-dependent hydrolase